MRVPRDTVNEQFWLLPYENPLEKRLGKEFFQGLPKSPGIYRFHSESGMLLYVGKAKDLRVRLQSYRRATPDRVSRKVIRMIHLTRRIDWELCENEEKALLLENRWLREHRPPFNVVNVNPEGYLFIAFGLIENEGKFRFRLAHQPDRERKSEKIYGAFKGSGTTREGYAALLRLFWACHRELEPLGFPAHLTRRRPPPRFELFTDKTSRQELRRWNSLLKRFLNGTSRALLTQLTEKLLADENLPRFIYRSIQEDLETLDDFYQFGPHRNRAIRKHHGLSAENPIAQEELDDLLTIYRHHHSAREPQETS